MAVLLEVKVQEASKWKNNKPNATISVNLTFSDLNALLFLKASVVWELEGRKACYM